MRGRHLSGRTPSAHGLGEGGAGVPWSTDAGGSPVVLALGGQLPTGGAHSSPASLYPLGAGPSCRPSLGPFCSPRCRRAVPAGRGGGGGPVSARGGGSDQRSAISGLASKNPRVFVCLLVVLVCVLLPPPRLWRPMVACCAFYACCTCDSTFASGGGLSVLRVVRTAAWDWELPNMSRYPHLPPSPPTQYAPRHAHCQPRHSYQPDPQWHPYLPQPPPPRAGAGPSAFSALLRALLRNVRAT